MEHLPPCPPDDDDDDPEDDCPAPGNTAATGCISFFVPGSDGAPNFVEDENHIVPPIAFGEPGAGPPLRFESHLRAIGSRAGERRRSRSINALAQINTDRGEEEYTVTDLEIPGVGFNYRHTRTYRSQATTNYSQGVNWVHNHQERIIVQRNVGPGVSALPFRAYVKAGEYPGDNARWEIFRTSQSLDFGGFEATFIPARRPQALRQFFPPGDSYTRLELLISQQSLLLVLYSRDGWRREYRALGGLSGVPVNWAILEFFLTRVEDANGNEMTYNYRRVGDRIRMSSVTDTLGRKIRYGYYQNASDEGRYRRLRSVTDFLGRSVNYDYDDNGNLVSVNRPAVVDASVVQNTFSGTDRKTETYVYSSGFNNRRLNDNLLAVYRANENDTRHGLAPERGPGGRPALSWTYYGNDRVKSHTIGSGVVDDEEWESGGTFTYEYRGFLSNAVINNGQAGRPSIGPNRYIPSLEDGARLRVTETDPRGNVTRYYYSELSKGSLVRLEQHIVDPLTEQPQVLVTRHRYSGGGLTHATQRPDGSISLMSYQSRGLSRVSQKNLIRRIEIPAPQDGNTDHADQLIREYRYAYDPIFNRQWVEVGPRGTQGRVLAPLPGQITPDDIDESEFFNLLAALRLVSLTLLPTDLIEPFIPEFQGPATRSPLYASPNGGGPSIERYAVEQIFDYQERSNSSGHREALGDKVGLTPGQIASAIDRAEIRRARILGLTGNPSRMGLGDVNGDGRIDQRNGKTVKTIYPSARLVNGSGQLIEDQAIAMRMQYDDRGQMTAEIDANGNLTRYEYQPYNENAPLPSLPSPPGVPNVFHNINNFTYSNGYLASVTADAQPGGLNLTTSYIRNAIGAVLATTDPRGNLSTVTYNELGQPIRTQTFDGPIGGTLMSEALSLYDANDNVIASYVRDIQTDGSGDPAGYDTAVANSLPLQPSGAAVPGVPSSPTAPSPAGYFGTRTEYNISNLPIRQHVETTHPAPGSANDWLTTETRYDANEMPSWTRTPLGFITTTLYDTRQLPYQVTSAFGTPQQTTVTNFYDEVGNLIRTVDGFDNGGESIAVPAGPGDLRNVPVVGLPGSVPGASLSVVPHTGDTTTMLYDGFNRLKRTTDPLGNVSLNFYDPAGNIVETAYFGPIGGVSPANASGTGNTLLSLTRMAYDEANRNYRTDRLVGVASGVNPVRTPRLNDDDAYFTGDTQPSGYAFPDLPSATPDPAVPSYVINQYGGWISGLTLFDPNGNVVQSIDDNGDATVTTYDALNRPVRVIDPVGNVSETFYDENSNVIQVRHTDKDQADPNNSEVIEAFFAYDALNRKTRAQATPGNDGPITDYYGYDSRSNPTIHIDARGNVMRSFFDAASRSVASVTDLTVDGTGDSALDPNQGGGDGRILTRSVYDPDSRLVAQIDDNNNRTSYEYDALNRKIKTTFGVHNSGGTSGNIWAGGVAVSEGEAQLYGVDSGGNLADHKDDPTTKTWAYDRDSNVTVHVDQNGTTHAFSYDGGHRRTRVRITPAAGNPHRIEGTTNQFFRYDGLGRQVFSSDDNGANTVFCRWNFDLLSRTLEERTHISGFSPRVQSWEYNGSAPTSGSGTPTAQVYADGRRVLIAYDANDRVASMTDTGQNSPIVGYQYVGPGNRVAKVNRPNGVDTTLSYDAIRRRTSIGSSVHGFGYAYDGEHQPRWEVNSQRPSESEAYDFDSAGRVVDFDRGALNLATGQVTTSTNLPGVKQSRSFKLDGVHNWQQTTTQIDGVSDTEDREHTNFNEIHTAPDTTGAVAELTYDDQGNLLRRDYPAGSGQRSVTYHWDGLNRLKEVKDANTQQPLVSYLHSSGNQRVSRTVSGGGVVSDPSLNGRTNFYYAGWKLCDEYSVAGSQEFRRYQYVWGPRHDDELVCRDDRRFGTTVGLLNDGVTGGAGSSGGRQYQLFNRGWNIRAVVDEAGNVLERYLYDPHGKPTVLSPDGQTVLASTAIDQDYGYTAQRYDRETQLWYFKHRYLDDGLGRFISRDPAGYVDGMNLYTAYFVLTGVDPLGLGIIGLDDESTGAAGAGLLFGGLQISDSNSSGLVGVSQNALSDLVISLDADQVDAYGSRSGHFRNPLKAAVMGDLDLIATGISADEDTVRNAITSFTSATSISVDMAQPPDMLSRSNYLDAMNDWSGSQDPISFKQIGLDGVVDKPAGIAQALDYGGKGLGILGAGLDAYDIATSDDPLSTTLEKSGGWAGAAVGAKLGASGFAGGPVVGTVTTLGGGILGGIAGEEAASSLLESSRDNSAAVRSAYQWMDGKEAERIRQRKEAEEKDEEDD